METQVIDQMGRGLRDLRISVTDRCNFRCTYCMPKEVFGAGYRYLNRTELLSFEEIERLVRIFAGYGVRKIRFTGGEPLVRRDLEQLIRMVLSVPGIEDVSLTSNASLITQERAASLYEAGIRRINVSLDAMDDQTFMAINDVGASVQSVLDGIAAAQSAGIAGVKVNAVIKQGVNEHAILPLVEQFRGSGVILRFIEFMDVGNHNGWDKSSVISSREILKTISEQHPLEPVDANYHGEVAQRWQYIDGAGEIGVISSITQPFCGGCHRARLSAIGQLFTCLFASEGTDLRAWLRDGSTDDQIDQRLRQLWQRRDDRYSEIRFTEPMANRQKVEMSYIGG
ncbi:MAG: GTP 3',8-cyclase MoaA [Gammaproteobacteria bacterium]|nr:GTP 3',8-cyclase MoaA [Gammaproteobacteria bacterium]